MPAMPDNDSSEVTSTASSQTRADDHPEERQEASGQAVNVESGRQDYEELRRQVTKHSVASGSHDEEEGFDLADFLRGMSVAQLSQNSCS